MKDEEDASSYWSRPKKANVLRALSTTIAVGKSTRKTSVKLTNVTDVVFAWV